MKTLNIKGREQNGIIDPNDINAIKAKIKSELSIIKSRDGKLLNNKIMFPEDIYQECKGIPPDIMIYPDDLNYRAISSVGWDSIITDQNDTGPDGANHDYEGIFILSGKGVKCRREKQLDIYDVTPTILNRMNLPVPDNLKGTVVLE